MSNFPFVNCVSVSTSTRVGNGIHSYIFCQKIVLFLNNTRPLGALAIINEFDQHNDTYFQYLGCIGSPEPLTVKSENSVFWKNCYTGCPKIRSMEDENDFVTLKIWTFDLALIKTQNCHLFESISTKKPWKNKENCSPPTCNKITMKMWIL